MNANKLLLGTLGLAASLGISGNTLAYVGEPAAYEFPAGFYLGLQGGYAQTWWQDLDGLSDFNVVPFDFHGSRGDFAGRVLAGYDFNELLAIELGFAYFLGNNNSADSKSVIGPPPVPPIPAGTELYHHDMKAYAIDLVGKLSLPLDNGFRLYTKFGAQYFVATMPPTFTDVAPFVYGDVDRKSASILFGVGASYQFTPSWSVDLSWSFYRGDQEIGNKYLPDTDFYALGLYYKFVCGP